MNLKAIKIQKKKLRTVHLESGLEEVGLLGCEVWMYYWRGDSSYDLPSFGLVKTEKVSGFTKVGPLYP